MNILDFSLGALKNGRSNQNIDGLKLGDSEQSNDSPISELLCVRIPNNNLLKLQGDQAYDPQMNRFLGNLIAMWLQSIDGSNGMCLHKGKQVHILSLCASHINNRDEAREVWDAIAPYLGSSREGIHRWVD